MRCQILLFIIIGLIVCCKPSNPKAFTEADKSTIILEAEQMLTNYYIDIKQHGLTAEFNYLDTSANFFWVPPGYTMAISYDSVAKVLTQNAPQFTLIENRFDTLRIIPLNDSIAIYTGKLRSIMTDTSGKRIAISLIETGTLIKRTNGWKLLNGQTSFINENK